MNLPQRVKSEKVRHWITSFSNCLLNCNSISLQFVLRCSQVPDMVTQHVSQHKNPNWLLHSSNNTPTAMLSDSVWCLAFCNPSGSILKLTARAQDVRVSLVPVSPRPEFHSAGGNTLTGLWCQYIKLFARMVTGDDNILSTSLSQISSMVWPPCYTRPNSLWNPLGKMWLLAPAKQNSRKEFTLGMRPTHIRGWEEGPGKSILKLFKFSRAIHWYSGFIFWVKSNQMLCFK